ncbi:MAG: hypothetical protein ACO3JL_03680 [Myxococcota bacterium]
MWQESCAFGAYRAAKSETLLPMVVLNVAHSRPRFLTSSKWLQGVSIAVPLLAGGCAGFGAQLPPGTAGPAFVERPEGVSILSARSAARRGQLDKAAHATTDIHFAVLEELIRSSFSLREQVERTQRMLQQARDEDEAVSDLDRASLLEGAQWFLENDLLLYQLWTTYRVHLPYVSEPDPYAPYRGASLLSVETRTLGGLVALTAELVRMDNARAVMGLLDDQWAITQFLNRGDDERGIEPESYDRVVGAFRDPDRRAVLKAQLLALQGHRSRLDRLAAQDVRVAFLLSRIDASPTGAEVLAESSAGRQVRFAAAAMTRSLVALLSPALDLYIARVLDRSVGSGVTTTKLASVPGVAEGLLDALRPFDVLVLRDKSRQPGGRGYSHAALYLGEYASLKASPVAEHVAFALHRAALRRGEVFLDNADVGAHLTTLDALLQAEDIVVLRLALEDAGETASILRAFDTLVQADFITPPQLTQREHAIRLLQAVFGADPSRNPIARHGTLARLVAAALDQEEGLEVPFATLDGLPLAPEKRLDAIRHTLERQGPLDEASEIPSL